MGPLNELIQGDGETMTFIRNLAFALAVLAAGTAGAAEKVAPAGRVMMVLDASGSMWGQIDGANKIVIARTVVRDLLKDWDPDVELGLMAYGHRRKGDCRDIELLHTPSREAPGRIAATVDKLNPKGKTPLSESVRQAAEALRYTEEPASIILVTDGKETCNVDPCALAAELERSGVDLTVHVVGFDIREKDRAGIACMAENTGGIYRAAADAASLKQALGEVVEKAATAKRDRLVALMVEGADPWNNVDLFWQVFTADDAGQPVGAALTNTTTASPWLELPPGRYVAEVKVSAASARAPIEIVEGESRTHAIVMNAATVDADYIIASGQAPAKQDVRWLAHRGLDDGTVSPPLDSTTHETVRFHFNAGKARVALAQDYLSAHEDLTLAAGEERKVTVNMRVGELILEPRLTADGAVLGEDVTWVLYPGDEAAGRPLTTIVWGGPRSFRAPAGTHAVGFQVGRTLRGVTPVEFVEGESKTLPFVLDAGYAAFTFTGEASPSSSLIGFRKHAADGSMAPLATMDVSGARNPLPFAAGDYSIAATGAKGRVEVPFTVTAGGTVEVTVAYPE